MQNEASYILANIMIFIFKIFYFFIFIYLHYLIYYLFIFIYIYILVEYLRGYFIIISNIANRACNYGFRFF